MMYYILHIVCRDGYQKIRLGAYYTPAKLGFKEDEATNVISTVVVVRKEKAADYIQAIKKEMPDVKVEFELMYAPCIEAAKRQVLAMLVGMFDNQSVFTSKKIEL